MAAEFVNDDGLAADLGFDLTGGAVAGSNPNELRRWSMERAVILIHDAKSVRFSRSAANDKQARIFAFNASRLAGVCPASAGFAEPEGGAAGAPEAGRCGAGPGSC